MSNTKLIIGAILIIIGLAMLFFLVLLGIGLFLIIIGLGFVLFGKDENIIEERQDLNKKKANK